ncbi:MAG: asparagine synthase (glutamine-hydrolyzing) [Phycisphaerae bacterium]
MCGIAGILALDANTAFDPLLARKMCDCLVHRGPDAYAEYADKTGLAILGFRRLSIIDLDTGMQPIANEDRSIHVVCNGEIYNFQSLRAELSRKGHQFTTVGDIEPVVHLYEEYGADFLNRLDGFFALALYDEKKQKLLLAVDRVGKKPIYYTTDGNCLYFASELKSIRSVLANLQIKKSSLIDYLRFGYIPAPDTAFAHVYKIPPGHKLEVHLDYQRRLKNPAVPPPTPYYHPRSSVFTENYGEAKSELTSLLTQAVSKRLIADVPLGILLSGGIDSSIVTALASMSSNIPIKTFSVGFKSELYNELPLAGLVAKKYHTDHTELIVEPEIEMMLDLVGSTYDEPFADSSAIPTYLICKRAAKFVRVVLTGDGGDEAFCGYDRYRAFAVTSLLGKLKIGKLFQWMISTPGQELRSTKTRLWRLFQTLSLPTAHQYSMMMRLFYEQQLSNLLGRQLKPELMGHPDFIAQTIDSFTHLTTPAQKANLCDYLTYLPGDLLVKIDRASMANSLETRAPLLDHALLEFAHSLPTHFKMNLYKGKTILRNTFSHLLPPELLTAPKRGFGVPLGQWLRGPLKNQMGQILNKNSQIVKGEFVDPSCLTKLSQEHLAGQFDHSARLWSLMVLEKFLQKNI